MTQIVSFTPDFAAAVDVVVATVVAAVDVVVAAVVVSRLSHAQLIVGAQLIFIGS